jgi:hypothetical protein
MQHVYHRYPLKTGVSDVRGVWPVGKLCEFAGTFLSRRKRWAVLAATGFGALDFGLNASSGSITQSWQTLGAMGGVIGLYLAGAYGLKYGPMLLQGRKRGTAEAANLNLMEDYRKSRSDLYLSELWDQVFCYEPFKDYKDLYPRRRDAQGQPLEGPTGLERLARAERDTDRRSVFFEIAPAMLTSFRSQAEQERHVGTGFEMLEDLLDAGPWTQSDRKLEENYDSHPRIQAARQLAGYGWSDLGHETFKRLSADMWFRFLRSSVAAHVGESLQALNEQYDHTINAQRLLWPGDESTPLAGLDQDSCVRGQAAIRDHQQQIMRTRLGNDWATACRKLGRTQTPMVELTTTLRARFDPAYVAGEVGDIEADLRDAGHHSTGLIQRDPLSPSVRARLREAADAIRTFDQWLADADLTIATAEQKRSARLAFHVNFEGMRDHFLSLTQAGQSPMGDRAFREPLCMVLGRPHPWTHMLIDVRMLHVLARVRRAEYEQAVRKLGAYERSDGVTEPSDAELVQS